MRVYDKVSWHYPDGKGCSSLEDAKIHLVAVMEWLAEEGLLSDEGEEIYRDAGIGSDFSITSRMLTPTGRSLLDSVYDSWLADLEYGQMPDLEPLRRELERQT